MGLGQFLTRGTLDENERERIVAAVQQAEALTSAEIVVVVDRIAGSWRSWAMALALLIALLAPWPLIELTQFSTRTIFVLQLLIAATLMAVFLPEAMRLKLVPRLLRRRRGHEVALREFAVRGLSLTRERTGVLIYVALAERYAEIVTDEGIAARIGNEAWRQPITRLIEAIDRDDLAGGLAATVSEAAAILAPSFPPRRDDRDEIPNKVIVI